MPDTHAVDRLLTEAEFTEAQVSAITKAVRLAAESGDHVTSDQFEAGLAELRTRINTLETQRTRWFTDPSVKAVCTIATVGISLASLLFVVGLLILTGLQENSLDVPPAAPGGETQINTTESRPQEALANDTTSAEPPTVQLLDDIASVPVSENQGDVTLSPDTDFSQIIRGNEITLNESLRVGGPVYLVAERVRLDAILHAPQIWIFAEEVVGGGLDVSGNDGTPENRDGSNAGSIYILATRVERVDIMARGGSGLQGGQGARGGNGRDGRCDGFGRWRAAQRGGTGGVGERGGNAGDGADVRIVVSAPYEPGDVDTSPGNPGDGGPGGDPGFGGDGCVGLGGAQPTASNGLRGAVGPLGSEGNPGTLTTEEKPQLVGDILSWLRSNELTVEALQYVRRNEQDNRVP